ncbi:MAG: hypothetical protein ACYTGW_17475 [Planctomycetota bacterium]|jgi:hypothetical protein
MSAAIAEPMLMLVLILVLLQGGCESVPGGSSGSPTVVKVVELLDPYFVRFENERMPIDEFLFRMRQRGREAAKTGKPLFGIRIVAPKDSPVDQKLLNRIMEDLQVSGIRHVRMG